MTSDDNPGAGTELSTTTSNLVGLNSAILTVVITVVAFSLAIVAIPNSGASYRETWIEYPYVNTLSEFPRDYLRMPPAMLLVVVSTHARAAQHEKTYNLAAEEGALIFAHYFPPFPNLGHVRRQELGRRLQPSTHKVAREQSAGGDRL